MVAMMSSESARVMTALLLLGAASKNNAPTGILAARTTPTPSHADAATVEQRKNWNRNWPSPPISKKWSRQQKKQPQEPRERSDSDRRVMPWVSIVILMNILFFFRSFAAPFFDPLGEPRRATASSVYFSLLAFLYIWLASVTTLTVLPQFATNYNIITATALFFYMVFVSICGLLVGRFFIRVWYYIWLFWKMGSSANALESQMKGAITAISRFVSRRSAKFTEQQATTNGKSKVVFAEAIQPHRKLFPVLVAFQRPFRRVVKSAVLLSAGICFIYSRCWSRKLTAFDMSREEGGLICRAVFLPIVLFGPSTNQTSETNTCGENQSCADERSIWILWAAILFPVLWAYAMNEFTGKHHKGYRIGSQKKQLGPSKQATDMEISNSGSSLDMEVHGADSDEIDIDIGDEDDEHDKDNYQSQSEDSREGKDPWQTISDTIQKFRNMKPEQPEGTLAMVSWYSQIVFTTGFDMLISFKVFLGRFDARKMQVALLKEPRKDTGEAHDRSSDPADIEGVFDFSNCNHYIQDDLPDSSEKKGFWFDFVSDCGDGFNSSYQISRLLAQPTLDIVTPPSSSFGGNGNRTLPRGKLLINGGDLAYPDPTPDSYEKRFFRTFEDAMPPPPSFRREHISIQKPALPVKGWDLGKKMACDEKDQGSGDGNHLSGYSGPCAFLIPGNHDWFDGLSTFTRFVLSRDWLGGWLMPQQTSYFALKLPRGWWLLGFDLALDDDINIEQFHFFANVAASMKPDDAVIVVSHVPHWVLNAYENHSHDSAKETNLSELIRTHLGSRVKLRLAGDLHHYTRHVPTDKVSRDGKGLGVSSASSSGKPVLIVSGGGGAFLHPTHCFQEQIKVGKEKHDYSRVCAYPSTKVCRHLSWLNLWQFRWRNWRLDILWALLHFGICSSLFPLCGVYDDYLRYNPTHHIGYLILWILQRVLLLFVQILATGRTSLMFTAIVIGIAYTFTDSSNLKWRTHLGWSMTHALAHISSALICLLFVECMAEFVVSEGLVVTENVGGVANTQSCGTGLATSIFDEYTTHFSHTLEDFQLLNTTNSTGPPDLLPSCRFDENMYEMVLSTFRWLYEEAPFLKTTLAVFDLPGIIGSTHVEMCYVLCSGALESECTYSNDFLMYQHLDRVTILKYLAAISLYFVIFAVPIAGNVFGTWLALTLNWFGCQYDEGFSSLRMEHWKNFLRLHVDKNGDLEIFAIGLHRVPKKWRKDPSWEGDAVSTGEAPIEPSWMWKTPSKWLPWRNRKKFVPQMIDYTKIKRTP